MKNLRHQIKSQWYYIFWGVCALSVVSGQIYVGTGYRDMAEATKKTAISVTCEVVPEYIFTPSKVNKKNEEFE